MTLDLYRKEAIEHRSRRLFGEIILGSGTALWWITLLLVVLIGLVLLALLGLHIETTDGKVSLLQWLRSGGA